MPSPLPTTRHSRQGPRQFSSRVIQTVVETGELSVGNSCPPGNLGKRGQVETVEASKMVLLGKRACGDGKEIVDLDFEDYH